MRSFFTNVWRRGLLLSVLPLAMAGAVRADEVTDWHEHMLVALRTAAVSPIVSTRDAALVSAAVFDAVNGIERRYAPIHVPAAAPRGASKRAAAVQAAYVILLARFPAQAADLNAKRAASLAAIGERRQFPAARRGVGTDSRRGHSRLAKHRWIHTAAAALSRRRRTRPMASDSASVCTWRGAAIRHHDSLGDPVARPISSRGASRAGQCTVSSGIGRSQADGQSDQRAAHRG